MIGKELIFHSNNSYEYKILHKLILKGTWKQVNGTIELNDKLLNREIKINVLNQDFLEIKSLPGDPISNILLFEDIFPCPSL